MRGILSLNDDELIVVCGVRPPPFGFFESFAVSRIIIFRLFEKI